MVVEASEPSPLGVLRGALPRLTGGKLRVAEVILEDPQEAGRSSITRIAERAATSPATVTRLADALGFGGFFGLRAAIALDNGRGAQAGWEQEIGSAILPGDAADQVLSTLAGNQFTAARSAMAAVDVDALERLADRIVSASRIHLFAEWGDAPVAYELYLRLFRIGIPIWFHEAAYFARVGASLMDADGLALVISRSGEGETAEEFATFARSHAATTSVITGDPDSVLATMADIVVTTGTATVGRVSWTDYFAGRSSDTLVCAVLWALVAQRMPDLVSVRLEAEVMTRSPVPRGR